MFVGVSSALAKETNCRCPADKFEPAPTRQTTFFLKILPQLDGRLTSFMHTCFEPALHA